MTIGVGIKVDTREVREAKKEIELFNQSLARTDTIGDLSIGHDAARGVRELTQEVNRLKSIATSGDMKGGILKKEQFTEAQRLMGNINKSMQDYAANIRRVGQEMKALDAYQRSLDRSMLQGDNGAGNQDKYEKIVQRKEELKSEKQDLAKQFSRMEQLKSGSMESSSRITHMDDAGGGGGGAGAGILGMAKKLGPWALAAAGATTVMAFLAQSRNRYQQTVQNRLMLGARGIGGDNNEGIQLGIGPVDLLHNKEFMSRQGLTANMVHSSTVMAAKFGRAYGMDPSQAGGIYGTMYQATGNAGYGTNVLAVMAEAVKKGMDKTRSTELMNMVARNTNITAQAFGGANPSGSLGGSLAWAKLAMTMPDSTPYKQFAKSGEFYNILQDGLKDAGTAPGNIMLFNALGGFDGPMSFGKSHRMNVARAGGFLKFPKLLSQIVSQLSGDKDNQAGQLESMMKSWGIEGIPAEQLLDIVHSKSFRQFQNQGKSLKQLETGGPEEKKLAADMQALLQKLPESEMARAVRDARWQEAELATGKSIEGIVGKISDGILNIADSVRMIADKIGAKIQEGTTLSGPAKQSTKLVAEAERIAHVRGLDPSLVKAVIRQESGWNPNAISGKGARGLMQLMPGTAEGLHVKDSYNPTDNMMGGVTYLKQMFDMFGGDEEKALAAYNAGPGSVINAIKKGGKDWKNYLPQPKETLPFIKNVQRYKSEYAGRYSQDYLDRNPTVKGIAGEDYSMQVEKKISEKYPREKSSADRDPAVGPQDMVNYTRLIYEHIFNFGIIVRPHPGSQISPVSVR